MSLATGDQLLLISAETVWAKCYSVNRPPLTAVNRLTVTSGDLALAFFYHYVMLCFGEKCVQNIIYICLLLVIDKNCQ